MKIILYLLLALLCQGCNFTITMVHTEGTASDVVDEESGASADVAVNPGVFP